MRRLLVVLGIGGSLALACAAGCSATNDSTQHSHGGSQTASGAAAGNGGIGGMGVGGGGSGGAWTSTGGGTPAQVCKVSDDAPDALPPCIDKAPADSFTPELQWEWTAPPNA